MTLGINKNKILLQGGKNFFAVFFLFFINNRSFIKSYLHITRSFNSSRQNRGRKKFNVILNFLKNSPLKSDITYMFIRSNNRNEPDRETFLFFPFFRIQFSKMIGHGLLRLWLTRKRSRISQVCCCLSNSVVASPRKRSFDRLLIVRCTGCDRKSVKRS